MEKKARKKYIEKIFKESQVMVLLEDMRDDIKIIAEGQIDLRQEMNQRFDEADRKLEDFKQEMYAFRREMYAFRDEMYAFKDEMYAFRDEMYTFKDEMLSFKSQTEQNFAFVAKQLLKIENEVEEIKKKLDQTADKQWVMQQLERLQKEMDELKGIVRQIKAEQPA